MGSTLTSKIMAAEMSALDSLKEQAKDVPVIGDNTWDINNVMKNTGDLLRTIGSGLMIIIGIVMIIVGIFKIAQGLISHGKTQVNWVINIMLIVVGALFCAGAAIFSGVLTSTGDDGLGAAFANTLNGLGHDEN